MGRKSYLYFNSCLAGNTAFPLSIPHPYLIFSSQRSLKSRGQQEQRSVGHQARDMSQRLEVFRVRRNVRSTRAPIQTATTRAEEQRWPLWWWHIWSHWKPLGAPVSHHGMCQHILMLTHMRGCKLKFVQSTLQKYNGGTGTLQQSTILTGFAGAASDCRCREGDFGTPAKTWPMQAS